MDRTLRTNVEEPPYRPKCYVAFTIVGLPLDLTEISEVLGAKFVETHRAGDITSAAMPPSQNDVWVVRSPLDPLTPLQDHLAWLRDRLEPHTGYLRSVPEGTVLKLYLGLTLLQDQNSFGIASEFVRFFGAINALVEMYILCNIGEDS